MVLRASKEDHKAAGGWAEVQIWQASAADMPNDAACPHHMDVQPPAVNR